MADAHGSGPCVRKDVGVQLPPCPLFVISEDITAGDSPATECGRQRIPSRGSKPRRTAAALAQWCCGTPEDGRSWSTVAFVASRVGRGRLSRSDGGYGGVESPSRTGPVGDLGRRPHTSRRVQHEQRARLDSPNASGGCGTTAASCACSSPRPEGALRGFGARLPVDGSRPAADEPGVLVRLHQDLPPRRGRQIRPYMLYLVSGQLIMGLVQRRRHGHAKALRSEAQMVRSSSVPRELWVAAGRVSKGVEYIFGLPGARAVRPRLRQGAHAGTSCCCRSRCCCAS